METKAGELILERVDKKVISRSLERVPHFDKLNTLFPFNDPTDSRDVTALAGIDADFKTIPKYDTARGWHEMNKNRSLWIVAYKQDVVVNGETKPFGRLEINHDRKRFIGGGQTIINFRRLGDEYRLEFRRPPNFDTTTFKGSLLKGFNFSDVAMVGILADISESLGDDPANDFLVKPMSALVAQAK